MLTGLTTTTEPDGGRFELKKKMILIEDDAAVKN